MGTAISPIAPRTTVKILMNMANVSLNPGASGNVVAMTRRSSQESISITPNPDGSVTITPDASGNVVASGPGSIACGGIVRSISTGQGSFAAPSVGNVTIGGGGPVVESVSTNPQPDEKFAYTVYVPSGTTVEFCEQRATALSQFVHGDQLRVLSSTVVV